MHKDEMINKSEQCVVLIKLVKCGTHRVPVTILVSALCYTPARWLIECLSVADCGGDTARIAVDLSHATGDKWCLVFMVSKGSATDEMPKTGLVILLCHRQKQ